MSTTTNFFTSQSDKSRVKTLIVTDFFKTYFQIINNSVGKYSSEIIYVDLFCGPGMFDDGQPSTPLALLNLVNDSRNDDIRNKLRIVFNDENSNSISKLKEIINNHEVVSKLKYPIEITSKRAGEVNIKEYTDKECPIFSFIDPWGYKDVSVTQTWELVKNRGSDSVLFFNSNRFIMDINKKSQACHLEPIFGDQLSEVEKVVNNSKVDQKQKAQRVVELFSKNLINEMAKSKYMDYKLYVLPFGFEADDKEKISHHILFITKSHKAIIEMKKVMLKHSNATIPMFLFDSKDQYQISLFNRVDFVDEVILEMIKKFFKSNLSLINRKWTVATLMEALDNWNMNSKFQVTPYSYEEVKETVKKLDREGLVQLILDPEKKIRENITNDREFKLKKELLV